MSNQLADAENNCTESLYTLANKTVEEAELLADEIKEQAEEESKQRSKEIVLRG